MLGVAELQTNFLCGNGRVRHSHTRVDMPPRSYTRAVVFLRTKRWNCNFFALNGPKCLLRLMRALLVPTRQTAF